MVVMKFLCQCRNRVVAEKEKGQVPQDADHQIGRDLNHQEGGLALLATDRKTGKDLNHRKGSNDKKSKIAK